MVPGLALVPTPFASGAWTAFGPLEVLAGEGMPGSQLVEVRSAPLATAGHRAVRALLVGDLVLGRRDPGFVPLPGFSPFPIRGLAAVVAGKWAFALCHRSHAIYEEQKKNWK